MKIYIGLLSFFLCSCQETNSEITTLCKLPKKLKEVSGMQWAKNGGNFFYVIQDSGNESSVYKVNTKGEQIQELFVNAKNTDWEDLTSDKEGNLYLGDFGNNDNERKDLSIYKITTTEKVDIIKPKYKVSFYYPEQTDFPPSKKELLYDCEAFFEQNDFFYLFTKNRSKGFDGTTLIYKIPNKDGHHEAKLLGKYKTGDDYNNSAITGSAISPDGSKFVLLSHSKIWLFENFKSDDFLNGKISILDLNHYSQKEAVCFKDNNTLLIADEKDKKTGGNVYEVNLESLKAKP
ncbi:hypothetical protein [Flavobacterium sp. UBA7682]|uniref:hypothetical protein n=1 Tax=Flavobacterium sp. UBA7682 TaxID=1946560 RepID=UPI0025C65895|nr:hypothetical protein [Flavobacterium sp. UBA7682]